jgi:rod shape-determining protein MreC
MTGKLNPILVNALLVLFLGLMMIWFSHSFAGAVRTASDHVSQVLAYPEIPAVELRALVRNIDNWVKERRTLQTRNRALELENIALRTALQRTGVPSPVSSLGLIGASVTLRYPDAWWKEIRVNKGASDGIVAGSPAMSEGYMIGRVSSVGKDYSWIELVTSSTFLLAAVVVDTWDLGVINGDDSGGVWLNYMPPDKELSRGMLVSTALVGDYLPPGIPLGMIYATGETRDGLMTYRVASGARLSQLYNVQILSSGAPR